MAGTTICTVEGCNKPVIKRDMCNAHYLRNWRHGSPTAGTAMYGAPQAELERILNAPATDECILWPFGRSIGYGQIRIDGKPHRVHNVVCRHFHGEPQGRRYQAAHSCGNKLCANPRHLRWATPVENRRDYEEMMALTAPSGTAPVHPHAA